MLAMKNRWWFVLAAFVLYYLHILNEQMLGVVIIGLVLLHVTHPDSIYQQGFDNLKKRLAGFWQ